MTQTQLLACLVALDIKTEDGKNYDSGTKTAMLKLLRNALDNLLGGDLLKGRSRSVLVVERGYVEVLTRHLVAEKKFIAMASTLQKTLNLTKEGFKQTTSLSMDQLVAGMRILFYQKKMAQVAELYENFINRVSDHSADA